MLFTRLLSLSDLHAGRNQKHPDRQSSALTTCVPLPCSRWLGVNAFLAGGFVPRQQRGSSLHGYVHVCDWYATLLPL